MARLIWVRSSLCATILVVWALSGRASPAESLRLITDIYSAETLKQWQSAGIRKRNPQASLRCHGLVLRGERDGMFGTFRTSEREQICSFPDEPMPWERWVLFVRTADVGRLKFSSFDDLIGHDVAVCGPVPGLSGKIEPLLSRSVFEAGTYVCFSKQAFRPLWSMRSRAP